MGRHFGSCTKDHFAILQERELRQTQEEAHQTICSHHVAVVTTGALPSQGVSYDLIYDLFLQSL